MLKYKYLLMALILLLPAPLCAATYYMGGVGDDYANLQAAFSTETGISSGDTLIIRDGTYTGATNVLDHTHLPPSGSAEAYTTIQAENPGKAIFDGENARFMFSLYGSSDESGPHHIVFDGLQWRNSNADLVIIAYADYIKMIRCSAYDAVGTGDDGDSFAVSHSTNILLEDCWSWGAGRKHFYIGNSAENIIVRRCVARHDRHFDYGDQECFMAYDCWNVEFQNCIAIDGDQGDYYLPLGITTAKAFTTRWGGSPGITVENINYRGCISLGNDDMLGWTGSNATTHTVTNCIHWDSAGGNRIRVAGSSFDHCTFGNISGTGTWSPLAYLEGGDTITNSLLYSAYQGIWNGVSDYNALYSITDEYVGGASAGAHDLCVTNGNAVNPIWHTSSNPTGALKYLCRIEASSALDGTASDSGDIGATILYRIGTSGTLYGETGYNTVSATSLWPFPNEALIKSDMSAYTYDDGSGGDPEITGARGFCAPGKQLNGTDDITLTSYIWEYLGNEIPAEIYGTSTVTHSAGGTANWR